MAPDVQFQSREEAKKARELEEARKLGIAPAEKDEEGKDINPHIPQYISKAPWYLNQTVSSLKHQRYKKQEVASALDDVQKAPPRSKKIRLNDEGFGGGLEAVAVRFTKGSCANCGARTHDARSCVERPRARGAKVTHTNICPDEHLLTASEQIRKSETYDSKRDRWYGYDNEEYRSVVREYERTDLERRRRKATQIQQLIANAKTKKKKKQLNKKLKKLNETNPAEISESDSSDSDSDSESDSDCGSNNTDDEDSKIRDFDLTSAPMGSKDENTRTTTRNLRIREDTAKYLFNLNLNSAFYDPKTRSMRDNPLKDTYNKDDTTGGAEQSSNDCENFFIYRGDNAVRKTGDALAMKRMELFAWEAYTNGANVHNTAQPTQLEFMYREHHLKKLQIEKEDKEALLDKYGGREHLNPPKEIIFAQTCQYVEYSRDGRIIKGRDRVLAKSKYEEDVCLGNHTQVWGSYFDRETRKWGYGCCKIMLRNSDCVAA